MLLCSVDIVLRHFAGRECLFQLLQELFIGSNQLTAVLNDLGIVFQFLGNQYLVNVMLLLAGLPLAQVSLGLRFEQSILRAGQHSHRVVEDTFFYILYDAVLKVVVNHALDQVHGQRANRRRLEGGST